MTADEMCEAVLDGLAGNVRVIGLGNDQDAAWLAAGGFMADTYVSLSCGHGYYIESRRYPFVYSVKIGDAVTCPRCQ